MKKTTDLDYWAEANGGFRASWMICLGAALAVAAVLLNLVTYLAAGVGSPSPAATTVAWLLYMSALWLLAGGFIWVGSQDYLSRFGFVVGALHASQAAYLLVLIFNQATATISPVGLTLARLASLVGFAWLERTWLDLRTRQILGGLAGLQLAKVLSRTIVDWPAPNTLGSHLFDALTLSLLAGAIFILGKSIRVAEDQWARQTHDTRQGDLGNFNNPEHSWNKTST